MFDGRVMGELPGTADEREIGLLMSGVEQGVGV
jgi:simple sugar transport system ATP-binding protein